MSRREEKVIWIWKVFTENDSDYHTLTDLEGKTKS